MREIKFRGKETQTGQWRYGDLTHTMAPTETGVRHRVMVGGYEVDEKTVGQFTGTYDREGKEIFEGDLIQVKSHDGTNGYYVVEYCEYDAAFVLIICKSYNMSNTYFSKIMFNEHERFALLFSVIGDVYDRSIWMEL